MSAIAKPLVCCRMLFLALFVKQSAEGNAWHQLQTDMHLLCVVAGAGMLSRGKLEYTGFAQPAGWAVPSLGALPSAQELLVVPDLHADHR